MPNNKRNLLQSEAIENISKKYFDDKNIFIGEYGTGSGKTHILLKSALNILEKTNKSVIISTVNNALVYDFLLRSKKYGIDSNKIDILIGCNNYVDKNVLLSDDFLLNKDFTLEQITHWLKDDEDTKHHLLTNSFLETFDLPDVYSNIISLNADSMDKYDKEELGYDMKSNLAKIENTPKIYITNHVYTLIMYRSIRNDALDSYKAFLNTPLFFDEVHTLEDSSKSVFGLNFSLFRLISSINSIIKLEELPKNHISNLKRMMYKLKGLELSEDKKATVVNIEKLLLILKYKEVDFFNSNFSKLIKKIKKSKPNSKSVKNLSIVANELKELYFCSLKASKYIDLSFSPTKQYPSLVIPNENPAADIRRTVFIKNNGYIVGVSGTLRISQKDSISENIWSFNRIGLLKYNLSVDSSQYKMEWNLRLSSSLIFKSTESIFSKRQAIHHIFNDDKYRFPKYSERSTSEQKLKAEKSWVENISECVQASLCGNMLVLMSSFSNCKTMYQQLMELKKSDDKLAKYEILYSKESSSITKLQKQHRNNVDRGRLSMLIGNLTFNTGIDLPNNYINTIVMSKIPFEPNNKMIFGFSRDKGFYDNKLKALLAFRQGLGRGIRSLEDDCFISICDNRLLESKYKDFYYFLQNMSLARK